ncbi:MAG: GTP cyclohydrolase II [Proteobacteria bacterium]|nr:GTP cyclohydrolase II [Pseudomonadota bacterium]
MFSYIDKEIREKLKSDKRLVTVDREGKPTKGSHGKRPFISILGPVPIPRMICGKEVKLLWYPFVRRVQLTKVFDSASKVQNGDGDAFRDLVQTSMSVNSILVLPGFFEHENPLVRIHSCCLTGDVFGSMRCECGPQLAEAFEKIVQEGGGAVIYMSGHEGRGIGLWAKAITYLLQDDGQDTYQANVSLGLPEDSRDFTDAAVVLRFLLQGKPIRLLSNNSLKREQLEGAGQSVSKIVSHVAGISEHNTRYLRSKRSKGHLLPDI